MALHIPDSVRIPKEAVNALPVGFRIRLLFDLVAEGVYLDVLTIADALSVHPVTIRKTISELERKGFLLDRRLKPSGTPQQPIEVRIVPLSQITHSPD